MLHQPKSQKIDRRRRIPAKVAIGDNRTESTMLDDEIFLQPWFIPKDVYLQIRRLLPNIHLSKMRYYFEDYGCLKCGERKTLYGSNGLCERCSVVIRGRLARALKRRLKAVGVLMEPDHHLERALSDGMTAAQKLLRDFGTRGSNSR